MILIDIRGQRFGRLVVLRKVDKPRKWLCSCDCGRDVEVIGGNLRKGHTRSCGCLAAEWSSFLGGNRDFIDKRSAAMITHGHKRKGRQSPEYRTWLGMKRRCYDPKCKDFSAWGGRGIIVCERWNKSFESFLADMGPRPVSAPTIDRLNHDGNYEPDNCRWATVAQQGAENRRGLRETIFDGTSFPSLRAACRAFGDSYTTVVERLKAGHSMEIAMTATRADLAKTRPRASYLPRNHPDRR